jgi:hypothetical protein
MKISRFARVFVIALSLSGVTTLSWSAEIETAAKDAPGAISGDAIVTKIDNGKVTLQALNDSSKEMTLPMDNTTKLKVGDKVKVQGNSVSAAESIPGKVDLPEQKTTP